nr:hypothetical protein [uncultured Draconibacterium sp.]
MNNEEKAKQAWQTPEIIDLDADATAGKTFHDSTETTGSIAGPS